MEFKQRKQITVLALVVLALSAITTLSGASAASASTPDDCLVYAYVEDGYAHYSLVAYEQYLAILGHRPEKLFNDASWLSAFVKGCDV